ncbi:MAG: transketolase [Patescibacteria group bacterium]|nr:transketolase [Patescibacteria group bacterium]MBU2509327.1 transketolase [Patescibacteria group bacterium]
MHLHDKKVKKLELIANKLRQHVIEMIAEAGSGHQGGCLGMADVFTVLYFHELNHDPKNPNWEKRDRLILSNGHICPIRYAAMAEAGYFPVKQLKTLRKLGSPLQGHPERRMLPGAETTSGPLGEGLPQSAGMAYAAKMDKKKWRVFCLTSDGEHEAGLHWEAMMFAGKHGLDNLITIIDRNNIQIDGDTEDVMPLEPLKEKYEAFNWHVIECDGNSIFGIHQAIEEAKKVHDKPICIIAHTILGRGVSFMENNFLWHSKPYEKGEYEQAMKELKDLEKKLKSDHAKY